MEPTKKHYFPVSHSTEFTQSLSSALVALHISPKRHTLECNTPDRSNFFDATGKLYLFICQSQSDASSSWWFLQLVYHWPSQRRQCEKVFLDVDIMARRGRRPWIFHSGSQAEVIRHSFSIKAGRKKEFLEGCERLSPLWKINRSAKYSDLETHKHKTLLNVEKWVPTLSSCSETNSNLFFLVPMQLYLNSQQTQTATIY